MLTMMVVHEMPDSRPSDRISAGKEMTQFI